ncbi:hypothetical protein L6452_31775 [Arctium lappa]|uniref:Uncharacterized protein n=1 Tax=Arctium lappa TaxID=4217 RepID=A0ACB8Z2Q4_ARCLA|nr:hypothetical protein L6452_31775 [Arctium lappa]
MEQWLHTLRTSSQLLLYWLSVTVDLVVGLWLSFSTKMSLSRKPSNIFIFYPQSFNNFTSTTNICLNSIRQSREKNVFQWLEGNRNRSEAIAVPRFSTFALSDDDSTSLNQDSRVDVLLMQM